MKRPEIYLRWIEGSRQLTDPLTKRQGEADLLRGALREGSYAIVDLEETLQMRKQERVRRVEKRAGGNATKEVMMASANKKVNFVGTEIYEFDALPEIEEDDDVDDMNYEAQYTRRLREVIESKQ